MPGCFLKFIKMEYLQNISPRKYQQDIFETCKDKNCLVVLPTGLGKTLIALMLAIERMKKFPEEKIVFLAPTRPLAEQHMEYFKKNLPELFASMELFTGKTDSEKRQELWQNTDIVFSTPQCIENDLKNGLYDLRGVSLLIVDECHRCLKNYAYAFITKNYNDAAEYPRVLGLTASPGHEKSKVDEIARNLSIEAIEVRTRESEDVKEYIQELNFEVVKLDFPEEFESIRQNLKRMLDIKVEELKHRKLLFGPANKKTLLDTQHNIMRAIASGNKHFNLLLGASACAQALKIQHSLELLETQTLSSLQEYFNGLFKDAKEGKSKAVSNLVKQQEFNQAYIKLMELIAKKVEHPKLIKLKEIVENELKDNPKFRVIIFAQFRDSVTKICKTMNEISGINARVFVGQAKKKETGMSQREQQELVHDFILGKINVLVATQIAEEGLDIPEVNAVIFYEPIPSAIRKIQRAGRTARLMKGKLIMLVTKKTRDEAYYWSAVNKEKKMYELLGKMKFN
jgi:Fanconi anemia group M protein